MPKAHDLSTVAGRLAYTYQLHPGAYRSTPDRLALGEIDKLCVPKLGTGHTAQIISGAIKSPSVSTLKRIADVLGCSFAWIVEGGREGKPTKAEVIDAIDAARERWARTPEGMAAADREVPF